MNNFQTYLEKLGEFGVIDQINYPIILVKGLPNVRINEIVIFESGQVGQVYAINRDTVEVLLFSQTPVSIGERVVRTENPLSVPVGKELLGHIINPLGNPIFHEDKFQVPAEKREIDVAPLGIAKRQRIKKPLHTGVSVIDIMVPLGKGQKQLVIGDRKTGKSTFLLSAIKSQIQEGSVAIYAAIARKKSDIKKLVEYFKKEGLSQSIIMVATSPFDSPSLIHLTPYTAMTIAEYFRDQGIDVLVVLDDLSTHAKFYREIALVAKNFPGRDSYPGDIFYTHAKLLERAGNFKHAEKGEVSISCLPIAETVEGDFTGFIPTNLMGMTDGHIYFDANAYYKGRRPAINIPLSVTRVGRQTQHAVKRDINRELTSFLTLYDKMQNLSHFGAELTDSVQNILLTGDKIYKFFNQSYKIIIPEQVQLVIFSMIWIRLFDEKDEARLEEIRETLSEAYKDPVKKKLFDDIMQADSFNKLLSNVGDKYKELQALYA